MHPPLSIWGRTLQLRYSFVLSLYYVVHCVLSPWGQWSSCSQTCVTSNDVSLTEKTRYRHVAQEGAHGGVKCPLNLAQIQPCDLCPESGGPPEKPSKCVPRCPVDCQWSPWNDWNTGSCRCPRSSKNPGLKYRYSNIKKWSNCLKIGRMMPMSEVSKMS